VGPRGKWGETARRILSFIARTPGASQKQIADALGLSKSTVSYHVQRLQRQGYLETDEEATQLSRALTLSSWKVLKVTPEGMRLFSPQMTGAHLIQYRLDIWKRGNLSPIRKLRRKNWDGKLLWKSDGITVEETTRSIKLSITISDPDPYNTLQRANTVAHNVKRLLESVGYVLGPPRMTSRPKFEIKGDPVAERVSKYQTIITATGAIDNTPTPGTLHFYDPSDVEEYFKLPRTVKELRENIQTIRMEQEVILSTLNELTSIFSNIGKLGNAKYEGEGEHVTGYI